MDCPNTTDCIFFNDKMKNMPSTSEVYKRKYCRGAYEKCARYIVRISLGKDKIPQNLYPNQVDLAERILGTGH